MKFSDAWKENLGKEPWAGIRVGGADDTRRGAIEMLEGHRKTHRNEPSMRLP